ncbi:DUF3888_domain-containing protein [Hexamita inflata]|uniref:DUF3888 domain-containing protein n=1 Tax=Hexamita inflata TaxID=28002 RepID=A0AA86US72_9EUKA|nr:DUF3888 domain-containing protein [Hexamita inflata]
MSEQNQNALNEEYNAKMTLKYEDKIKFGNLEIGDRDRDYIDSEVTNLMFVEKFNIQTLKLCISIDMYVKLRSNTIKELILGTQRYKGNKLLNFKVDDLDLENLEVLDIQCNNLENHQLYNLIKFNKLHSLDVSRNKVDLTYILNVTNLTKLFMRECGLNNIQLITSLVNLEELDLSYNTKLDLSPLCKVKSLIKLTMIGCGQNNSISLLINLKELDISQNWGLDITSLKDLVSLIKLNLSSCNLKQISALKYLINLQNLNLSNNTVINITELQYLKNLKRLNLDSCRIISIYILQPLLNLEELRISCNRILYLDANLNEMKKLEYLKVNYNFVSNTHKNNKGKRLLSLQQDNRISSFKQLEKHKNYNNQDKYGYRSFDISLQQLPSQEQLRKANQLRNIESPNFKLKQIQNKHKTVLHSIKQQIYDITNNARSHQIKFTNSIISLFQLMNQFGFE